MEAKEFSERVSKVIFDRELDISEAARKCGMSYSALRKTICEDKMFTAINLIKFCRAMNVSADWLLGLKNEETKF